MLSQALMFPGKSLSSTNANLVRAFKAPTSESFCYDLFHFVETRFEPKDFTELDSHLENTKPALSRSFTKALTGSEAAVKLVSFGEGPTSFRVFLKFCKENKATLKNFTEEHPLSCLDLERQFVRRSHASSGRLAPVTYYSEGSQFLDLVPYDGLWTEGTAFLSSRS